MFVLHLQDETVTLETVVPFEVAMKFMSSKVRSALPVHLSNILILQS